MKAVLISIKPQWCEKIISGEKTIEVRKTRPKIETPFKCYIYCTKGKRELLDILKDGDLDYFGDVYHGKPQIISGYMPSYFCRFAGDCRGKVIGESVCDRIEEYTFSGLEAEYRVNHIDLDAMCLNHPELINYGKGEPLYGLHISDLKIYDKPKELDDFFHPECTDDSHCDTCPSSVSLGYPYGDECNTDGYRRVIRPPKSWCYVEELEQ